MKKKNEEFIPDRTAKYKKGELDLPITGSEFPGLPIEATEKPKIFFKNPQKGTLPDINELAKKHE